MNERMVAAGYLLAAIGMLIPCAPRLLNFIGVLVFSVAGLILIIAGLLKGWHHP